MPASNSWAHQESVNTSQKLATSWIESVFQKRECSHFISTDKDPNKCGCGRTFVAHASSASRCPSHSERWTIPERWTISKHTAALPTDAFGTIEFQGGPHPQKAQYVRLGFDSDPERILELLEEVWKVPPPKLVITVHGGLTNFSLQPKLARVFRKGLLKAARTTGAWIITSGINAGVVRHVASALGDVGSSSIRSRSKIVTIGIAPWGLLKKREDLIGRDKSVSYHPQAFSPKGRSAVLNDRHSFFLLVDNGTVGKYGADIILRKRLEEYISQQTIEKVQTASRRRHVPVVCVVLEGGTCTIRSVWDYVTNIPPVPVVVCDGSGRAADLIAFAHQYVQDDGSLPDGVKPQLLQLVQTVFGYEMNQAEKVIGELLNCVQKKHLITVFRLGEDLQQDVDHAILTALLKGQNLSAPDQLSLALTWNRVDIARTDIFVLGQEWPTGSLENAMMDALMYDRVEFVKLLLENGVSMERFLTIHRLEELYRTDKGPSNILRFIVRDVVRTMGKNYVNNLPDIGLVIEKLMGFAYRSVYTSREFKSKYKARKEAAAEKAGASRTGSNGLLTTKKSFAGLRSRTATSESPIHIHHNRLMDEETASNDILPPEPDFRFPFNELLIWAVLTKRQEMARCMWLHGEEALPKALVACKLFKSLAGEAADDYLEGEVCEELKQCAEEFRKLSLDLLEHCYQVDDDLTIQLLTSELKNWGKQTCLSLAYIANNKEFLAHPCCQILLADLWHGALRIRRNSNLKVLAGILFPPYILCLDFKTKEELLLQPQTEQEHLADISGGDSAPGEDIESDGEISDDGSDVETGNFKASDSDLEKKSISRRSQSQKRTKSRLSHSSSHESLSNSFNRFLSFRAVRSQKSDSLQVEDGLPLTTQKSIGSQKSIEIQDEKLLKATQSPPIVHIKPTKGSDAGRRTSDEKLQTSPPGKQLSAKLSLREYTGRSPPILTQQTTPPLTQKSYGSVPAVGIVEPNEKVGKRQLRSLKSGRKFREFYMAPITTFWMFVISYVVFLLTFTYVVLVATPSMPSWPEWFVVWYIVGIGMEQIRRIFMSEPKTFFQKLKMYSHRIWNWTTGLAVVCFLIAFILRMIPELMFTHGRVLYGINIVFWYLRILDIMSINSKLGPYITMVGKMVIQMSYIITILTVVLMSFGVARQSIHFPRETFSWQLVRNIFFHPYFMLYGEVYAPEIDSCGDEGLNCEPGVWITPLLMAAFLLLANICLINLIVSVFNNIYQETNKVSHQVWKFQRYEQVMEYEAAPSLPPPLVIFCDIFLLFKYCLRQRKDTRRRLIFDYTLKLFMDDDDMEKLHDFEEECMDDMWRQKEFEKNTSTEERIRRTADRTEMITMKLNDIDSKESATKSSLLDLQDNLEAMEATQMIILERLNQLLTLQQQAPNIPAGSGSVTPIAPPISPLRFPSLVIPTNKFGGGVSTPAMPPLSATWSGRALDSVRSYGMQGKGQDSIKGGSKDAADETVRVSESPVPSDDEAVCYEAESSSKSSKLRTPDTSVTGRSLKSPQFQKPGSRDPALDIISEERRDSSASDVASVAESESQISPRSPPLASIKKDSSVSLRDSFRESGRVRRVSMEQPEDQTSIPTFSISHASDSDSSSYGSPVTAGAKRRERTTPSLSMEVDNSKVGFETTNNESWSLRVETMKKGKSMDVPEEAEAPKMTLQHLLTFPSHGMLQRQPSSRRRRQRDEYTSITDNIALSLPLSTSQSEDLTSMPAVMVNVADTSGAPLGMIPELGVPVIAISHMDVVGGTAPSGTTSVPDPSLQRAKPSFIHKQNEMLREFEETSSRITGGLIRRKSISVTSPEEQPKDVAFPDSDIKDYLECIEGKQRTDSSSHSNSSLDSLSYTQMEVTEGVPGATDSIGQRQQQPLSNQPNKELVVPGLSDVERPKPSSSTTTK